MRPAHGEGRRDRDRLPRLRMSAGEAKRAWLTRSAWKPTRRCRVTFHHGSAASLIRTAQATGPLDCSSSSVPSPGRYMIGAPQVHPRSVAGRNWRATGQLKPDYSMAGCYVLSPMRKLATTGSCLAWSSEAIELLGRARGSRKPYMDQTLDWPAIFPGAAPFTEEGRHRNPGASSSVNGSFHLFPRTIDPR